MIIPISDLRDRRLDDYRNIPDPELLRARGIFMAEGRHVVRRLLQSQRFTTRSLLLTPAAHEGLADVVERSTDIPVYVVSQEAMNEIAGFNIHRGCLAIGVRPAQTAWDEVVRDALLVVVLEGVSNADNVGGIFRSAAAFGAGAVLLGPACTDPLYRKAIRTSMGAALRVPFAVLRDWPGDLARLRRAGFHLVALTPDSSAVPLGELDAAKRSPANARTALLVGHEGDGLSGDAIAAADVRARIPMVAGVDSLNVATAASIALYELTRRRSGRAERARGEFLPPAL